MPPLPGLDPTPSPSLVPVIDILEKRDKGKTPVPHPPRRQYNDNPLPIKPSTTAPKNAHIVGRQQEYVGGIVSYQLKIGDVEINDVDVDEILEYVSALELEQFERQKFREEAEIQKILEQQKEAEMKAERKAKLARAAEKARNRGVVFVEEGSDSDGLGDFAQPRSTAEVQLGKHGRARPDYSKFYKPPRGKGKQVFEDTVDQQMAHDSMQTNNASVAGAQKRRRRKRDPVTGELMPLAPLGEPEREIELDQKVRRRRKRHPQTGELMPLGWSYDPEAERIRYEKRRVGVGGAIKEESSFKRLSISDQHQAKRVRLDTESPASSSASPIPTKAEIMGQAASYGTPRGGVSKANVVDLMSSDDEASVVVKTPRATVKSPAKQAGNSMMRGTIDLSAVTTSADESSPEPPPTTSITRPIVTSPSASQRTPKIQQPKTSILSPSAARASSTDIAAVESEDESSDDEAGEDEWFIESILGHRMSDPKSHPPELGKQPVMLYSVKWEGYESPTWEPVDSFGDRSFVDAYRKKAGLKPILREEGDEKENSGSQQAKFATKKQMPASMSNRKSVSQSDDDDEDEEWELDKIVAHHLSDPRTHPKTLGKTPVMLYQVKWKGFEEMSWEPEESFDDDPAPLIAYKRRHGLR